MSFDLTKLVDDIMAQQLMMAKAYCAKNSKRDHEPSGAVQMFRSGGPSDAKPLSVKFPNKLGIHFIDPLKG
ncbi:hypothetical protein TNCV_4924651 [Trichonephila clavipes]|nr:hypothetical protein TNCV_4924651 [Trichonephila clavipes]